MSRWGVHALMSEPITPMDGEALASPEGVVTLDGERFKVEATGETEILNLGSYGEQIGHWYPVQSPLYRLVPADTEPGEPT